MSDVALKVIVHYFFAAAIERLQTLSGRNLVHCVLYMQHNHFDLIELGVICSQ